MYVQHMFLIDILYASYVLDRHTITACMSMIGILCAAYMSLIGILCAAYVLDRHIMCSIYVLDRHIVCSICP